MLLEAHAHFQAVENTNSMQDSLPVLNAVHEFPIPITLPYPDAVLLDPELSPDLAAPKVGADINVGVECIEIIPLQPRVGCR